MIIILCDNYTNKIITSNIIQSCNKIIIAKSLKFIIISYQDQNFIVIIFITFISKIACHFNLVVREQIKIVKRTTSI